MISAARILGLAAAGVALLAMDAMVVPANAQAACKDRITAKSEGRIRGEGFATNEAKQRWEREAEERFGRAFGKWANAKEPNVECESVKSQRLGLPAVLCTASARPCENTQVTNEKEDDRKRRDKIGDRNDREERFRNREEREREWHRDRFKRAYEAEMRFQDWLAKRRREREKWAERREAAYYRHLYRRWSNGPWYD